MPDIRRVGNDLVTSDGATYNDFYGRLEADPFSAGVYRAATAPMRIHDVMDFSSMAVLWSLNDYSLFQLALPDRAQRERFNQGWSKAFALSTQFAFDEKQDMDRFNGISDTLIFFGQSFSENLAGTAWRTAKHLKRGEFTALQRGMCVFALRDMMGPDASDSSTEYDNFSSIFGNLRHYLRGVNLNVGMLEENVKIDGAAAVIADIQARRQCSAFIIGHTAMETMHSKNSILD